MPHLGRRYPDAPDGEASALANSSSDRDGIHRAPLRRPREKHPALMKKIEAVIRSFKVDEVKDALVALGVGGMTVSGVRGVGQQPSHVAHYGGAEYTIDLHPKTKIEVVVADSLVEPVITTICNVAWTGLPGDGKVFALPLAGARRIRTDEVGDTAL